MLLKLFKSGIESGSCQALPVQSAFAFVPVETSPDWNVAVVGRIIYSAREWKLQQPEKNYS